MRERQHLEQLAHARRRGRQPFDRLVDVLVQGDLVPTFAAPEVPRRDAPARAALSGSASRGTAARRERIVALAAANPTWSRRRLAAEASVSDATVRRMEGEGLLRQGTAGWEIAAALSTGEAQSAALEEGKWSAEA